MTISKLLVHLSQNIGEHGKKWTMPILSIPLILTVMTVFIINVTNSAAPPGIYWIHWGTPIHRGDLVLMRHPMKRLVGIPGDTVQWAKSGVWLNGKLLPHSAIPANSPYPPFPYQTLVLLDGQYLAMGDNDLSFDGRYFGPEPRSLIEAKVTEAWVF